MPRPSPFHARTAELCESYAWKDWAGYHAVCRFGDCHEREYLAVRHGSALIDVSPLYKYEVRGPGAAALLARVTVRDVTKQKVGVVSYTCWCDDHGKVLDDGTVTRLDEEHFRMTAAEPTLAWLARHARGLEVELEDVSERLACLAVQGPTSRALLASLCDADLDGLRFFRATGARFEGGFEGVVTRTGYTGDLGYEVWVDAGDALALYDACLAAGRDHGARPTGLDALDVARIEAGFVLLDVDYFSARHCMIEARKSTPTELGLDWMLRLDRDPFVGREALQRERENGSEWALVGLDMDVVELEELYDEVGLPLGLPGGASRDSVPVYSGGRQVGYATSRAWSPTLKRYLALATVEAGHAKEGTELRVEATVEHHRHTIGARVARRPFFDPERKKATPA